MEEHNQTRNSVTDSLYAYKVGLGAYTEKMPDLVHRFNEFTQTCFQEGTLNQKQKQLIALGISLYSQDEYCIIYHTKGCLDQGCTEEEILEVIGVTAAFGGGAALSQGVTLVQEAIKELGQQMH
ncbi:AhpD family alkylhydroperoxidase [Bacillus oleivorans]|uniref:AhpD family alkylhydroperoxidase n=1 Tax=Bacillus oleivorans TaxID=1448271 RepID=A0A285CZE3_9BACI|nr:carboxymuconolactone decarboxylase family protein [Bacillus oleivorans]SNX72313.1 AhpD family alkylhydroperoxidase [Bacillus oleivorans]